MTDSEAKTEMIQYTDNNTGLYQLFDVLLFAVCLVLTKNCMNSKTDAGMINLNYVQNLSTLVSATCLKSYSS